MNSEELKELFLDMAERAIQWEYSYWLAKKNGDEEMMAELTRAGEQYYGKLLNAQKTFPDIENRIYYYRYGRTTRDSLGDIQTDGMVTGSSPYSWGADPKAVFTTGEAFDAGRTARIFNDRKRYAILSIDTDYLDEHTLTWGGGRSEQSWSFREDAEYRLNGLYRLSAYVNVRNETTVSHGNINIDDAVRDAESRMDGRERLLLGGYTVEQHALMGNIPDALGYWGYQSSKEDALARYRAELEEKNTSREDWTIYSGRTFRLSPQGCLIVDPVREKVVLAALELQPQPAEIIRTEFGKPYRVPRGEKSPDILELGRVMGRSRSDKEKTWPDHAAVMMYIADHFAEYMAPPGLSFPKPPEIRYPKVWCYFMRSLWLRQQGAIPE